MREAIDALRIAFRNYAEGRAGNLPRRRLFLDTGAVLHQNAAWWGGFFGTKIYSTHPKHGAWFTFHLYDAETARPLAQFEADWLGQIRTGAVSGLAADLLAPQRSIRVGIIGSGFQARSQVEAVRTVREVRDVRVWSRNEAKREKFAAEMGASPVASAEEAAAGSDILITATFAKEPVIDAEAVESGTLVLAMGSNHPHRRELPPELVKGATVVVEDTEACRIEAGDLLLALDEGDWKRVIELRQLLVQKRERRDNETIVFKSVGLGLEDVAAAAFVFRKAEK
jgi:ornithine cyclodeaminase/alanine dehydrogenase-like protein (mu-crystallin family)